MDGKECQGGHSRTQNFLCTFHLNCCSNPWDVAVVSVVTKQNVVSAAHVHRDPYLIHEQLDFNYVYDISLEQPWYSCCCCGTEANRSHDRNGTRENERKSKRSPWVAFLDAEWLMSWNFTEGASDSSESLQRWMLVLLLVKINYFWRSSSISYARAFGHRPTMARFVKTRWHFDNRKRRQPSQSPTGDVGFRCSIDFVFEELSWLSWSDGGEVEGAPMLLRTLRMSWMGTSVSSPPSW